MKTKHGFEYSTPYWKRKYKGITCMTDACNNHVCIPIGCENCLFDEYHSTPEQEIDFLEWQEAYNDNIKQQQKMIINSRVEYTEEQS